MERSSRSGLSTRTSLVALLLMGERGVIVVVVVVVVVVHWLKFLGVGVEGVGSKARWLLVHLVVVDGGSIVRGVRGDLIQESTLGIIRKTYICIKR